MPCCKPPFWCDGEGGVFSAPVGERPAGAVSGPFRTEAIAQAACPLPPVPLLCCDLESEWPQTLFMNIVDKTGAAVCLPNSIPLMLVGSVPSVRCGAVTATIPPDLLYSNIPGSGVDGSLLLCVGGDEVEVGFCLVVSCGGVKLFVRSEAGDFLIDAATMQSLWEDDCPPADPDVVLPATLGNFLAFRQMPGSILVGQADVVISQ